MPYKDPQRKRQWEREHREERNARRRKAIPVNAIDPLPNSMAAQSEGTDAKVGIGAVVGFSLLLILLIAGLGLRNLPKMIERVQPGF